MERTDAFSESNYLSTILRQHFGNNVNLARCKLISLFVICLCKLRTVNFERLASGFDTSATTASSLRRIQRFIAQFHFRADMVARLVFALLPPRQRFRLAIDRTNWQFGGFDINIFMLGVVYEGVAFPLLFTLLPKRGNSNSQERIDLMKRFIALFGKERIECVLADREFIGKPWVAYLNREHIRYYIRIRNNFKVWLPHAQKEVKAFWLFNHVALHHYQHYHKPVQIRGEYCYLSGCRLPKGEYLIIISFSQAEKAKECYGQRWQIEMCFKAMKSSGFDIEKTHLQQIERVEKLILLVMIAFVWCYKVGIYRHQHKAPIKVKKHGRKAKSIFRYGLDYVSKVLLDRDKQTVLDILRFLSCT